MTAPTRQSNQHVGEDNLRRLAQYLAGASGVPARNGKANISAIALAAAVDRQVLYRPEARAAIAAAVAEKGLAMPEQRRTAAGDEVPAWARQRIMHLEAQLAAAKAESADLRARLRRYEHLERHLAETGRLPR